MHRHIRLLPVLVSFLMVLGFGLHLANLGVYLQQGQTHLDWLITPLFDGVLFAWMAFCSVLLLAGARPFFASHDVRGWKKVVYFVITGYVGISLPFHIRYLTTGDLGGFAIFPWWYSAIIMGVYVLIIAFMLSIAPRREVAA